MEGVQSKRYQIKIVDADLRDLVHEIANAVCSWCALASRGAVSSLRLYPSVFEACKSSLQGRVRGFHVCGCRPHCDLESGPTELGKPLYAGRELLEVERGSGRVRRYVLLLDIPLKSFARDLEVRILRAVAEHAPVKNWRGLLFPVIREAVERVLSQHLYDSPTCNRGEYLCEVGVCTEFDPWTEVRPQTKEK